MTVAKNRLYKLSVPNNIWQWCNRIVNILMVGLSYGARNVLSIYQTYTRCTRWFSRYGTPEPGIIKPVNSWNRWIINFQWNMVEKFTARKVHWFGILDPAHYLPVPVVQSVTLPNSPTFNETYIFEITIKNGVDSWVLGLSNQRKIFGPISDFFTFSATTHLPWPRSQLRIIRYQV